MVDDIEFNRKLLEAMLNAQYYDVIIAKDGKECLDLALEKTPDAILMDVMMPVMDGFEATRMLRSNMQTCHIPIILITALNAQKDKLLGLSAGADDFLNKPINENTLMMRLKSLIRVKFIMDELRTNALVEGNAYPHDIDQYSLLAGTKILLLDDSKINQTRITEKLSLYDVNVEALQDLSNHFPSDLSDDYSLIIVNTKMRDYDGLRMCSQIRSNNKLRNIPVLIIVDESDEITLTNGIEIGVSDYISEPIEANELLARCTTQIKKKHYQDALRSMYSKRVDGIVLDSLTNLYNKKHLLEYLESLLARADYAPSLLMVDVDNFKQVNDTYGHIAGDKVLKTIADCCTLSVRESDMCARFGGEEFTIVLPRTNIEHAVVVAERIRELVAEKSVYDDINEADIHTTVSIGATILREDDTLETFLNRADTMLYKAKASGKNMVVTCHDEL